jgi:autotransporter-associated beta strand protein
MRNGGTGTGPSSSICAYSGMAVSPGRVIIFGGGHNDYPGNDIWQFDTVAMTFTQLIASDVAGADPLYTDMRAISDYPTFTYPGSLAVAPATHPCHPVGRHTRKNIEYDPTVGKVFMSGNSTYSGGTYLGEGEYLWLDPPLYDDTYGAWHHTPGDIWLFNLSSGLWEWKLANPDLADRSRFSNCVYNPNDGLLYLFNVRLTSFTDIFSYDTSAGAGSLTKLLGPEVFMGDDSTAALYPAGNLIYILSSGDVKTYDITANTIATISGITGDTIPSGDGCAIEWDSHNSIFIIYANSGLYSFEPISKVCTKLSPSGAPAPPGNSYLFGMFRYDAVNNLHWYLQYIGDKARMWSYRYA